MSNIIFMSGRQRIVAILIVISLAAGVISLIRGGANSSYDDCVKEGNPVSMSYPPQCTDKKGTVHTQKVDGALPPGQQAPTTNPTPRTEFADPTPDPTKSQTFTGLTVCLEKGPMDGCNYGVKTDSGTYGFYQLPLSQIINVQPGKNITVVGTVKEAGSDYAGAAGLIHVSKLTPQ